MIRIHKRSVAAACACIAVAALPAGAHACSLAPFPIFRGGVHLIATVAADTVLAGPGDVRYTLERGDAERTVYGQVATVEQVPGADAAIFPAGINRVVLVPWGYDASCRRTLWTSSARWVEPGTRGLFIWADLRPREQWVEGVPTFDVGDPYQTPYPQKAYGDSLRSIEQVIELLELLPLQAEYEADAEAARRPLLAWARANPELARRYPASALVRDAVYDVRYARLKRIDSPLAGTYRFTVSVNGDAPRTFYARTYAAPDEEWSPWTPGERNVGPALDDPFRGYTFQLAGATSADLLPTLAQPERDMSHDGHLSVLAAPERGPGGVQVWHGEMGLYLATSQFPGDSALVQAVRAASERSMRRVEADQPEEIAARLMLRPDGSVTMEQTTLLDDGPSVVIRGERISRVTIPDPDVPD